MSRRVVSSLALLGLATFALVTAQPSGASTGPINLIAGKSTDERLSPRSSRGSPDIQRAIAHK